MAWKYDPRDAADCLPEGEYDAELSKVTETTSKAGSPMLAIEWSVIRSDRTWVVKDFIVQPSTLFKLKAIARVLHKGAEFEVGEFDLGAEVGQPIRIKLSVEASEKYGDRNSVTSYSEATFTPVTRPTQPGPAADANEEIPF